MPFQRPSTLARSGAPERAFESQTYWMNDVIASGGSTNGTMPIAASAASVTVTNSASIVWSSRPPNIVASPRRRATMPSNTSVTTATTNNVAAHRQEPVQIEYAHGSATISRSTLSTFAHVIPLTSIPCPLVKVIGSPRMLPASSASPTRVLITGANGHLGRRLIARLAPSVAIVATVRSNAARQAVERAAPTSVDVEQLDYGD